MESGDERNWKYQPGGITIASPLWTETGSTLVGSTPGGQRQIRPSPSRKYQISSTFRWRTGLETAPGPRVTWHKLARLACSASDQYQW